MWGEHETVLSEIFRDGYEINLLQIDTAVNKVDKITNKNDLKKMVLASAGGTELSPGIDYILKPENKLSVYPTIILTDGYTDVLDFQGSMNQFLILTIGNECPVTNAPNVKQIKIQK
jgi:predicted metal-dependent peptidase